ncbi:sortase [Candidatus Shapirobacteria bacterium]|jgi:sortase A|nr:sortase [Candidatus Shapirobacteria bacterium]HQI13119.1 sortase [Candidatus Woesebacteria bacterium]
MAYLYVKSAPKTKKNGRRKLNPTQKRVLASFFFFTGLVLFASVVLPILHFQLGYSTKFDQILNPLSPQFYSQTQAIATEGDLTNLSSWFVDSPNIHFQEDIDNNPNQGSYYISIPKLKITDAEVILGSEDLKKSLIQYPKTALPGQYGSAVVFGHSVLPQFFNAKSYITIFSTLYRLKEGDEIYVDYDRIRYKYLVTEMYEVQPTDLSVLEQRFDGRYLTLITCTPPGTYLRRLVVVAQIADNS